MMESKLTPKLLSTLTYLQSILDEEDEVSVHISKGKITLSIGNEGLLNPLHLDQSDKPNPIKDLLDHINEEMCTDCVSQEWLYKHSYFSSLVRSYVDTLIHEFGNGVPIPRPLAVAILNYEVSDYPVLAYNTGSGDRVHSTRVPADLLLTRCKGKTWKFYLDTRA